MVFRSKEFPQYDFMIDYVVYHRMAESSHDFNLFSIICWQRVNETEFDKYVCKMKGYNYIPDENGRMSFGDRTTFPYPFFGEMKPKSIDAYINKYNMKHFGNSEKNIKVFQDDELEYSADLEQENKKNGIEYKAD